MEPEITTALISGSVAIISPIITLSITRIYDRRALKRIKGRQTAITGKWVGQFIQEINNELVGINLELNFTAGKKIVEGIAEYVSPNDNSVIKLNFTGGFHNDMFIKFDYLNPDESVIQFGSSILELSSDGRSLSGKFVGFGSNASKIVNGDVSLKKSA